ncbi:glycoside hydrolase family 19 protein [Pseudomonas oleovorans]|uniref:glycoside hydrolase family 19 protein n=1 Tax=Ectopseudomonas oleovorans TaxID=301 RepID=UPI0019D24916|nr:glycoside hydrolase family 19 protein [Pseudomonas oleovorans]
MLQHDEQGFLVGARLNADEITGQLESIHDELKAIRAALAGGSAAPAAPPAVTGAAPMAEAQIARPRPSAGDVRRLQQVVVIRERDGGGRQGEAQSTPAASSAALAGGSAAPAAPPAVTGKVVVAGRPAGGEALKQRDASGRFSRGDTGGSDDSARTVGALAGVGERIAGAIREMGDGSEEADPSVKALNEIAQPLSRGFGKIFGGGQERKQERWYRRFWREITQKRREDQAANKTTQRTLKNIERKPTGSESSSGLLGFAGVLLAPLLGLFSKLLLALSFLSRLSGLTRLLALMAGVGGALKRLVSPGARKLFGGDGRGSSAGARPAGTTAAGGARSGAKAGAPAGESRAGNVAASSASKGAARGLLKRIPLLGTLLGAGYMVSDIAASEGGEGTRREKDAATGSAVGRGIGGLGGMAGGAAVGAAVGSVVPVVGTLVGGLVGGALGGFLGDSAGDIIGEKVGLWVNDLRRANVPGAILDAWHLSTDFFSSLWQQASSGLSERWASVSAYMSETWASVSAGASALWESLSGTVSAGWASLSGTLSTIWSTAVGEMQRGWGAALAVAAKGWEAFSSFAGKAGDWLKDKTGVDLKKVYSGAKETAGGLIDGAKNAVSTTWDKAVGAASSAAQSVKSGAKAVADATGVSGVVRSVKNAASYAKGKNALRHAMAESGITDPNEQAAFMAQMDHESAGFTSMQESFNYRDADRLMAVSGSARRHGKQAVETAMAQGPEAVAELMYGGRMGNVNPGDAHAFRGRGFVQLTGRDNYTAASRALGIDLVSNPDMAADPEVAAKVATWYWKSRPGLSEAAKNGDVTGVTKKINGGTNGLADRQAKTEKYLAEAMSGSLTVDPAGSPSLSSAPADAVAVTQPRAAPSPVASTEAVAPAAANPVAPPSLALVTNRAPIAPAAPAMASTPSIPAVPTPAVASIAEAPSISVPLGEGGKSAGRQVGAAQDVPRDLPDRRIAHVVTGAYSGMG